MIRYRASFFLMTLAAVLSAFWSFQDDTGRLLPTAALAFAIFLNRRAAVMVMALAAGAYLGFVLLRVGPGELSASGLVIDLSICAAVFVAAGIVGTLISDIEDAVAQLVPVQIALRTPSEAICQQRFEDEVRRARRFDRPLSVVGFRLQDEPSAPCPELIHQLLRRYASVCVKGIMVEEMTQRTTESDVIAVRNGTLIAMLPETPAERADQFIQRLRHRLEQVSGSRIKVASVEFPNDQSTLSGLLGQLDTLLSDEPDDSERSSRSPAPPDGQLARREPS